MDRLGASLPPFRLLAAGGAGVVALAGATGFTQRVAFAQPGALKYALTVGVPLVLVWLLSVRRPLLPAAAAVVVCAPCAGLKATFSGVEVSPLLLLLVLAGAIAIATESDGRLSTLGIAVLPALALLVAPALQGPNPTRYAVIAATMLATAWICSRAASLPGGLAVVLGALVASAGLQGALALWEATSGNRLDLYGAAGSQVFGRDYFFQFGASDRPTGTLYDPISLGTVLALACPVGIALAVKARSLALVLATGGATMLAVFGLAASLSRMSWVGAAAGAALTVALLPPRRRLAAAAAVAVAATLVISIAPRLGDAEVSERFASIFDPTSSLHETAKGDRQRVDLWRGALATAGDQPLAGIGLGNLQPELERRVGGTGLSSHAHSTYLQILAEAGALGAIALLALLGALGRDLLAGLRRERILVAGVAGGCLAFLVTWGTDYTVRYAPVAATIAVLLGAAASRGARRANL